MQSRAFFGRIRLTVVYKYSISHKFYMLPKSNRKFFYPAEQVAGIFQLNGCHSQRDQKTRLWSRCRDCPALIEIKIFSWEQKCKKNMYKNKSLFRNILLLVYSTHYNKMLTIKICHKN